jgi:hypothetical protein
MKFTLFALSAYVILLVVNFVMAGISHHVKAVVPLWGLAYSLNKIAALCVLPAILVDVVRFIF